ncbi:hypothetical protein DU505_02430 [Billgrantia montanilacus]|uniref:Uncharacterized protein n=1 Tax=Billgrantia montanilacus TaxID=2282305 RepID=A0A368UA11_9GAMM|nr:hypothetical protein DU505_02430 [Halomonas montanilacus]
MARLERATFFLAMQGQWLLRVLGDTAGSPSATSRRYLGPELKLLQQFFLSPLEEKTAVGALVPIATGAGRRLGVGREGSGYRQLWQHRREAFSLQSRAKAAPTVFSLPLAESIAVVALGSALRVSIATGASAEAGALEAIANAGQHRREAFSLQSRAKAAPTVFSLSFG